MKKLIVLIGFLGLAGSAIGMEMSKREEMLHSAISKLIDQEKVDDRNKFVNKGFRRAVLLGDLEMVNALIKFKADVNSADEYGFTPLMTAAANNHLEIVNELIEKGADVNATDNLGNKALDYGWNNEDIRNVLYPKTTGAWKRRYSQKRYMVPAAIAASSAAAYLGYKKPWKYGK